MLQIFLVYTRLCYLVVMVGLPNGSPRGLIPSGSPGNVNAWQGTVIEQHGPYQHVLSAWLLEGVLVSQLIDTGHWLSSSERWSSLVSLQS
jgi:hypothetical protein